MKQKLLSSTASLTNDMEAYSDTVTQRLPCNTSINIGVDSGSRVENLFDDPYVARVATEAYALIVDAWELDDSDAERLLAVNHQTWMRVKNGKWSGLLGREQLTRISVIIGLHEALHSCFGNDSSNRWVKRSNTISIFSERKPIDVMIEGGLPAMIRTRDYMGALLGVE